MWKVALRGDDRRLPRLRAHAAQPDSLHVDGTFDAVSGRARVGALGQQARAHLGRNPPHELIDALAAQDNVERDPGGRTHERRGIAK